MQVSLSAEYWTLLVAWITSSPINILENCTQVWWPPPRKDNEKRESSEEDGYGTGNPPCSEELREPDLLLRRSRPDAVRVCSTCTGKSSIRGHVLPPRREKYSLAESCS